MCIGHPVQVIEAVPGRARGRSRFGIVEIDTALVGACAPGDWVLAFLGSARERLDAQRAAEINATLALLEAGAGDAAFALPSALDAPALRRLLENPA